MARQRRHQQDPRLRLVDVLLEMQQRAERRYLGEFLAHLHVAVADLDLVDAERRPLMGEAGARDQLVGGGQIAQASDVVGDPASGWPIALKADAANMRTGTMMSECAWYAW